MHTHNEAPSIMRSTCSIAYLFQFDLASTQSYPCTLVPGTTKSIRKHWDVHALIMMLMIARLSFCTPICYLLHSTHISHQFSPNHFHQHVVHFIIPPIKHNFVALLVLFDSTQRQLHGTRNSNRYKVTTDARLHPPMLTTLAPPLKFLPSRRGRM